MATKKKPLTKAQKKANAEFKKQMQEKGILPPDKKRLNRKKFIQEQKDAWNNRSSDIFMWEVYLQQAISIMIGHVDHNLNSTLEAVGAAKVLALALRLQEFNAKLKQEGRATYTLKEQLDFIKDILEA